MSADVPPVPPRPAAHPVELTPVDRTHRAVLEHLGQLYRYDLSEPYGQVPNPDGTFNNRRLDLQSRRAAVLVPGGDGRGRGSLVDVQRPDAVEPAARHLDHLQDLSRVSRPLARVAAATSANVDGRG